MKVGSLVVCIENCLGLSWSGVAVGEPILTETILTVRNFRLSSIKKHPILYFEEITNRININTGFEYGYPIHKFREVLPPGHETAINELLAPKEQELETV